MSRNRVTSRISTRRLALVGVAGVATLAIFAPSLASGDSISELNARISSAQSQAQSLGAQVQQRATELAAAQAQAQAAAAREAELSAELAQGEQRAAELQTKVDETHAQLVAARKRLHRALDMLADRLVAIYKGDTPDATELLLDADGFDDLANRAELLARIEAADNELAARVRQLRNDVAAKLAAAQKAHAQQLAYNQQIAAARDQIAAVRARAEQEAAAADAARQQAQAALSTLQSNVATWEQQVEDLQAAQLAAQQAAEEAAQQEAAQQEAAPPQPSVDPAAAQQEVSSWFGDWAIPSSIVQCESGGNFGAVNPSSGAGGAYQILPSTWRLYGGAGAPQDASPGQQSAVAAQIWRDSGPSAWECAQ